MKRRVLIPALVALALLLATVEPMSAQTPQAEPSYKIYHIVAKTGPKPVVPAALKPFTRQLKKAGNQFRIVGRPKPMKLKPGKTLQIVLPNKLGKGFITLDAKGAATVVLVPLKPRNPKDRASLKSRLFPIVILSQKFKINKEQYVFLLQRVTKKK